jgi:hypothetical protein
VILLKVALLLGVEIHVGVSFVSLLPPPEDQDSSKYTFLYLFALKQLTGEAFSFCHSHLRVSYEGVSVTPRLYHLAHNQVMQVSM